MQLLKQLDQNLLNLAWSLWTELGVAGVKHNHPNVLIWIEELIILTSVLAEIDPRLRDESLDWIAQFHHFISVTRLKSLVKPFGAIVDKAFSQYAATLNHVAKANWPVFVKSSPLNIKLSHKSVLRPHLSIRTRALFGTGARADLITFFIVHPNVNFSTAELAEIGYSKRNIAEMLDALHVGHLLDRSMQGNQHRYRLPKNSPLIQLLQPIPELARPWHHIFQVVLTLRDCIQRTEHSAESTKMVELRNCLSQQANLLQKLGLTPPVYQNNVPEYLEQFGQWILDWTQQLASKNK